MGFELRLYCVRPLCSFAVFNASTSIISSSSAVPIDKTEFKYENISSNLLNNQSLI